MEVDRIQNEEICLQIGVALIEEKMWESRLRWFGHMQKRAILSKLREQKRDGGRRKITLVEVIKKNISIMGVT